MKKLALRAELARLKRVVEQLRDEKETVRRELLKEGRKLSLLIVTLVVSHHLCPVFNHEGEVRILSRREFSRRYGKVLERKISKAGKAPQEKVA